MMPDGESSQQQLMALANRFHAALTAIGRTDLAGFIQRAGAAWDAREFVVVICGDTKRGKSSLGNAVLGRPDLLPVDADVATSAQIFVSHGTVEGATATRWGADGVAETVEIGLSEIEDYGSMAGDVSRRSGVTRVHVRLDHPLLASGLTLVDTPGFGALGLGHRELAAAMIELADIVVLTVSCDDPVRRSELEFLATHVTRLGMVAIAFTRVDLVDDVDLAVADLRRRLGAFTDPGDGAEQVATRLAEAEVFPVSSRLAARAARAETEGRGDLADDLSRRSGLDALVDFITTEASRPAAVRVQRLQRLLDHVAYSAASDVEARMRESDDGERRRDVRAIQLEIDRLGKLGQRCRMLLGTSIPRAQTAANRAINAELSTAEVALRHQFAMESRSVDLLADLPSRVESTLQAAWMRGAGAMVEVLTAIASELASELDASVPADLVGALAQEEVELDRIELAAGVRANFDLIDHGLPAAVSTTFIANLVSVVLGPIGLVVGAATGGALVATRLIRQGRHQTVQANSQILNAALRDARADLGSEVGLRLITARQSLDDWIDEVLGERRSALQARRDEVEESARQTAAQRTAQRSTLARQLSKIHQLHDELRRWSGGALPAIGEDGNIPTARDL